MIHIYQVGQTMFLARPVRTVNDEYTIIAVIDLDYGMSVTNNAEAIVEALIHFFPISNIPVLIYRDTCGIWDGIMADNDMFQYFFPIGAHSGREAVQKVAEMIKNGKL